MFEQYLGRLFRPYFAKTKLCKYCRSLTGKSRFASYTRRSRLLESRKTFVVLLLLSVDDYYHTRRNRYFGPRVHGKCATIRRRTPSWYSYWYFPYRLPGKWFDVSSVIIMKHEWNWSFRRSRFTRAFRSSSRRSWTFRNENRLYNSALCVGGVVNVDATKGRQSDSSNLRVRFSLKKIFQIAVIITRELIFDFAAYTKIVTVSILFRRYV